MRPTRVVIDLSAIRHNLSQIRLLTGGRIMMAIKADAYGHGAKAVGRFVQDKALSDMFGVSCIEEGIQLREAGIEIPILIFGLTNDSRQDIDALFSNNLTPTVVNTHNVDALASGARRWDRPMDVHVKTDTGMGRLGLYPEKTIEVIEHISSTEGLGIAGLYTHLPVSDIADREFTSGQIRVFNELADTAKKKGISVGMRHLANSGGVLSFPESYMDMVRPGILCYGLYPYDGLSRTIDVRPAMTLSTAIMFIKRVKKETGLSYGLTYKPQKDTNIAIIPIGYADGYLRALSNKAQVLIQGRKYPVVGRICMDQTLIDLGDDLYPIGEEVIMFGEHTITAETIASWAGTIPYEITCNMSRRVPRMYSENHPSTLQKG